MDEVNGRDSGVGPDRGSDEENNVTIQEGNSSVDADSSESQNRQSERDMATPEEQAAERLAKATALLAPYIPVFRSDPLAKVDIKARDIDRQVLNYNRRFKSWMDLIVLPDLPKKTWCGVWKSGLTDEALDVIDKLTYAPGEDSEDYETVAKKFLEFLTNKRGSKYTARVQFRSLRQAEKEPFASYLQRLRSAAAPCRWPETVKNENMIEQLIAGHKDERVRAILFDLDTDDLDKYVKKCEALEIASLQAAQVVQPGASTSHAVDSNYTRGTPYGRGTFRGRGQQNLRRGLFRRGGFQNVQHSGKCGWCGGHEHGQNNADRTQQCKARNYYCQSCGCKGHYERCCRNSQAQHFNVVKNSSGGQSSNTGQQSNALGSNSGGKPNAYERNLNTQNTDHVQQNEDELLYDDYAEGEEETHTLTADELSALENSIMNDDDMQVSNKRKIFLAKLAKLGRPRAWFENITVKGVPIKMKIDSGSSVNTLPWNVFLKLGIAKEAIKPTKATLISYSQHVIVPAGTIQATIKLRGRVITDSFMVLRSHGTPLLGLGAARALGLLRVEKRSIIQYQSKEDAYNPEEIEDLGVHGEPVDIKLKPDVKPVNLPSRRVPIRLKARVEETLKRMVALGVIRPVNHPTDWCHPMLATDKKQKGKVRVCIDPKHLNPHIKRPMYQLPDIDALLGELGEARLFSTVDLECGFWQVPVTEATSDLLTFGTPYGRFQYLRLPFGIASAPEEFHRRVVQAVAGIKGVLVYIDDLVIYAKDRAEHDEIVQKVLKALQQAGFTLNMDKCKFAQARIKFLGHVVENGKVYPDPEKIEAIRNFPTPKNQKELRAYVGLIGWIRKFRADLMVSTSVFRPLLREDTTFCWTEEHTAAMKDINNKLAKSLSLEVFRPGEKLELWTDASPYGYGAILLQNQKPLYCASRSLTSAEKNYPQIDLELGAIAWAFERLDNYVYGSHVQVYTDHKPLVSISKKQIGDLSIRQQRMFARLMRYDYEINWVSEKLMCGPDALSRAPQQLKPSDEKNFRNPVAPDGNFEDIFISELSLTDLSDPLISQIQAAAQRDQQYQALVRAVRSGFPEHLKTEVGELWSLREGVYEAQNLVFRDRELIVPFSCRRNVIRALHRAHKGLCAMLRRAEGNVFWPGIRRDLQQFRDECSHCQENWPQQQRQQMLSIEVPTAPGLALASDYFQSKGEEYVLFVDVFSSWTEYFKVHSRRPETLISKLKQFIARNGVPRTLYSDKGSAYESFEFRQFCQEWGIKLITCSGEYPQGNGTAEAAVKRIKKWLSGAQNESDLTKAILTWHQTPIAAGRPTPAQLHLGRNVRDEVQTKIEQCHVSWEDVKQWRTAKKESDARVYNQSARNLPDLQIGEKVFVSIHGKWRRAIIEQRADRP